MFILPTYKRPEKLRDFVGYARDFGMTAPVLVMVQGEENLPAYKPVLEELPENWKWLCLQHNIGMVAAFNMAFASNPNLDWYGCLGDDMLPKTERFDHKCLSLLEPYSIISCSDETADGYWRAAGINIMSGPLVRACGFMYPPCTWHICGDDWLQLVGKAFGIWRVATDVIVSNTGFLTTGKQQDETQKEAYKDFGNQIMQYHRWLAEHGGDVMERIRVQMMAAGLMPAEGVSRWRVSK